MNLYTETNMKLIYVRWKGYDTSFNSQFYKADILFKLVYKN